MKKLFTGPLFLSLRGHVKLSFFFAALVSQALWFLRPNAGLLSKFLRPLKSFEVLSEAITVSPDQGADCNFNQREIYESVIVGSGPGGAIAARFGAIREKNQLVIEKGRSVNLSDSPHSPNQMLRSFDSGGVDFILSWPPIPFAQGSALGGGSEVNSGLYHEVPDEVGTYWERVTGLPVGTLHAKSAAIEKMLSVNSQNDASMGIYANSPLKTAGRFLGFDGGIVPRWRTYKDADNYVHHGMESTILNAISQNSILSEHEVKRIFLPYGRHKTIRLRVIGKKCSHLIKAHELVLAAGAVETPRLLVKSKILPHRELSFMFHAMARLICRFERKVNDQKDIDPHQYWSKDRTIKLGAAVGTPSLLRATLASQGLDLGLPLENIASYYVSIPSKGKSGFTKFLKYFSPYFLPSKEFVRSCQSALSKVALALENSGAQVLSSIESPSLSTVHIFGSLPIGTCKGVDEDGFLLVKGKRVGIRLRDSSILPSHPLVNPQGPMMQLVWALEERLYEREDNAK